MDNDKLVVQELEWDTDFFKIKCGKIILTKPITQSEWNQILLDTRKYRFVSIENRNSEPINAQIIGRYSNAFLADINVQFEKKTRNVQLRNENIKIVQGMAKDERVLQIARFEYSKFVDDKDLEIRGGSNLYRQWLINSFEKKDKYFAISCDQNNITNGFLLFSYKGDKCIIELVAVDVEISKKGVGSDLFRQVEVEAQSKGITTIHVGTQIRNQAAINFYHQLGCKQVGCHQIFHLWNN